MQQHGRNYLLVELLHPRPLGWGQKVKIQLFQNMVMLHIKLNGIKNAATCMHMHILDPWGGVKGQNNFCKVVMLHIKLKGIEQRAPCKHIFCPYIHPRHL